MLFREKYEIQEEFNKNNMTYELVAFNPKCLVYELFSIKEPKKSLGYEVHKLRLQEKDEYTLGGKTVQVENKVRLASNEEFGRFAWSYNTWEHCMKKYRELTLVS